jgi:prepilin-type N-terminal cleavage/methylation domain-containing protein
MIRVDEKRDARCIEVGGGRSGMTLIEMLVAMAASLLLMSVIAQLFGILGKTVSDSSNVQALNGRVRGVARMLRTDLGGITVNTLPPIRSDSDAGYFELIEGPNTDYNAQALDRLVGDCDDVLLFTSRSLTEPYKGRFNTTGTFESQTAELAWFCMSSGSDSITGVPLATLYRRQLLTTAYVGQDPFLSNNNSVDASDYGSSWQTFYNAFDLSCRLNSGRLYPNSLGDLTKRENRFLHSSIFPHGFQGTAISGAILTGSSRMGDDVVLTNVIGFDVRVYDPAAVIGGTSPGAYVDLNWGNASSPVTTTATFPAAGATAFQGKGVNCSSSGNAALPLPTYDTWSTHYEVDGVNQGDAPAITLPPQTDEGTNGRDDNGDGLVDDSGERETSPPYPLPLRGIEVRIRCYEPSSRQVRQVTVRHTFVPH